MINLMIFDIKVTEKGFNLCILNVDEEMIYEFDNEDEANEFYEAHDKSLYIYAGEVNEALFKTIIIGISLQRVKEGLDQGLRPYEISRHFNKIQLYGWDVLTGTNKELNQLAGSLGLDIGKNEPIDNVLKIIEIFNNEKNALETNIELIKAFNIDFKEISSTKQQMAGKVLKAKHAIFNESEQFKYIELKELTLKKYRKLEEFFKNINDDSKSMIADVYGLKHSFGLGGLHAGDKYSGEGFFVSLDVSSMYPSIMINYNLVTRSCRDILDYKFIVHKRLMAKANKDPIEKHLKVVINATYGAMNYPNSILYDPQRANNTCYYGQLMILNLIEDIERSFGGRVELIQTNTDGIFIRLINGEKDLPVLKTVVKQWEDRFKLKIDYEFFNKIIQKDVNNYVLRYTDGTLKRRGDYFKEATPTDNNLEIVRDAVCKYLIDGTPIEETINSCNDIKKFSQVIKIGKSYPILLLGDKRIDQKVNRIFACKGGEQLTKKRDLSSRGEKIANIPLSVFIHNEKLTDEVIDRIDKDYYIDLANKRIKAIL